MIRAVFILLTWLATLQPGVAGEAAFSIGAFDVNDDTKAMVQVELDTDLAWAGLRPQLGLFVTGQSAAYLYAGLGYPFQLAERWQLTPSISAGYYKKGAGKDLGHDLEFYSQLRLNYAVSVDLSVGIGIAHISNAGLGEKNPGANMAYASCSRRF